jgi:hypothetical protein
MRMLFRLSHAVTTVTVLLAVSGSSTSSAQSADVTPHSQLPPTAPFLQAQPKSGLPGTIPPPLVTSQ